MNKLLVGAIATGLVGSSVISGAGVAAGDSVLIVPGTAPRWASETVLSLQA